MVNIKQEVTGVKHTESSSRKGDFAEYYAVTWLWDNGYEVFKNYPSSLRIDIIASRPSTAPDKVKPWTAQAAIFFLFIL